MEYYEAQQIANTYIEILALRAEMQSMIAENELRASQGLAQAYNEAAFKELQDRIYGISNTLYSPFLF